MLIFTSIYKYPFVYMCACKCTDIIISIYICSLMCGFYKNIEFTNINVHNTLFEICAFIIDNIILLCIIFIKNRCFVMNSAYILYHLKCKNVFLFTAECILIRKMGLASRRAAEQIEKIADTRSIPVDQWMYSGPAARGSLF